MLNSLTSISSQFHLAFESTFSWKYKWLLCFAEQILKDKCWQLGYTRLTKEI